LTSRHVETIDNSYSTGPVMWPFNGDLTVSANTRALFANGRRVVTHAWQDSTHKHYLSSLYSKCPNYGHISY